MDRRTFLQTVPALLPGWAAGGPKPVRHIVLILIDDLGVSDLGCTGSDFYSTPHTDRFASTAARFTNAYAAGPVCSPTRASLATGRYPHRLHLTTYIPGPERPFARLRPPDWIKYLRQTEVTYAEALRRRGMRTCHIGKWHLGTVTGPAQHGFTDVVPVREARNAADPWHVDHYTTAAERFLEAHREERFLLVLSHGTVHVPLYERPGNIARYRQKPAGRSGQNNAVMAAMIETMDGSVGRVIAKIGQLGLERDTAVIFCSDNGGLRSVRDDELGRVVTATSNWPYRGGKSQLYEGGIRVPLIVRWPGVSRPGQIVETPVISNDLYPSMLDLAGLPRMPEQHLDGVSFAPLLEGRAGAARNTLYWHYPHYQTMPPHGAIRCGDWKLIEHYEDGRQELFDLSADKGESQDLSRRQPETAATLRQYLHRHLDCIGAQMPGRNPHYDPARAAASGAAIADPREREEAQDARNYVTDAGLDCGSIRPCPPPSDAGKGR